jgi:hypothetical protein
LGTAGRSPRPELQQFAVEPAPVEKDPAVAAAEDARDAARAAFDEIDIVWQAALAAKSRAGLYVEVDAATRRRLDEEEATAREARDHSWRAVVAANDRLHDVSVAAAR